MFAQYMGHFIFFYHLRTFSKLSLSILGKFQANYSGCGNLCHSMFCWVLLIQAVIGGGLSFSSKTLGFKWNKLDPIKGLGRIFSMKA